MKKLLILCAMVIALGFVATGCGGGGSSKPAPTPAPATDTGSSDSAADPADSK